MKRFAVAAVVLMSACGGGGGSSPTSPSSVSLGGVSLGWTFTPDAGIRLNGVDPEALVVNGSVLLFGASQPPNVVSVAADGLNFSPVSANTFGSSASWVGLSNGQTRMFYSTSPNGNSLNSAISTASDGLHWANEAGSRLDLSVGDGVPMVIGVPGGGCRAYYAVQSTSQVSTAFASDCLTFTRERAGVVTDAVDPSVLSLGGQGYLMVFSAFKDHADTSKVHNTLALATSSDGLTWTKDAAPIVADASLNFIDPTAVPLGDGSFRIYYTSTTGNAFSLTDAAVRSGVIRKTGATITVPAQMPVVSVMPAPTRPPASVR
jgi:predicted GH43/DUF377 family glycosyl hydrolase